MFIDEADIHIKAGKGGDGAVSFRRERFVPRGGPDGGDGGDGGSVIFVAQHDMHALHQFRSKKNYDAENGQNGIHKKMHGKNGQDLVIAVPLGTIIYKKDPNLPRPSAASSVGGSNVSNWTNGIEIIEDGQTVILAKGGRGGWGNIHFATSIKQAPEWSKLGLPGDEYDLHLELQLIADIGLVGMPNAGKSTFLSIISNARPKIADYPFTTLEPQLGVATVGDTAITIADIPGLIEGASRNKGLGVSFLKHIGRTKALLYILDATDADAAKTLTTLRNELKAFDPDLLDKKSFVAINKIDSIDDATLKKLRKKFPRGYFISCATKIGLRDLMDQLALLRTDP